MNSDLQYGVNFLLKNKEQIIKLCGGPSEAHVVSETIKALGRAFNVLQPDDADEGEKNV